MQKMTDEHWRAFVSQGTRTGKLLTVRARIGKMITFSDMSG